jgi:hypothetical protein
MPAYKKVGGVAVSEVHAGPSLLGYRALCQLAPTCNLNVRYGSLKPEQFSAPEDVQKCIDLPRDSAAGVGWRQIKGLHWGIATLGVSVWRCGKAVEATLGALPGPG